MIDVQSVTPAGAVLTVTPTAPPAAVAAAVPEAPAPAPRVLPGSGVDAATAPADTGAPAP